MKRIRKILSAVLAFVMIAGVLPLFDGGIGGPLSVIEARADQAEDDALAEEWLRGLRGDVSGKAAGLLLDGIIRSMVKYQNIAMSRIRGELMSVDGAQKAFRLSSYDAPSVLTIYANGELPEGADPHYTPVKMSDIVSSFGLDPEMILNKISNYSENNAYGYILDSALNYTGIFKDRADVWNGSAWDYFIFIVTALYQSNRDLFNNILFDKYLSSYNNTVYGFAHDVNYTVRYGTMNYTLRYDMGVALTDVDIQFAPSELYIYSLRPFFISLLKALYPDKTIEDFRVNGWIPARLRWSQENMSAYDVMSALFTPLKVVYDAIMADPADAIGKLLPTLSWYLSDLRTNGFFRREDGFCYFSSSIGGGKIDEASVKSTATGGVNQTIQNIVMNLAMGQLRDKYYDVEIVGYYLVTDPAELALDDVLAAELLNNACSVGTPYYETGKDLLIPVLYNGDKALYETGEIVAVPESEEYSMPLAELIDSEIFAHHDTLYDGIIYYVNADAVSVNENLHSLLDKLSRFGYFAEVDGVREFVGVNAFARTLNAGLHLPEAACAELNVTGKTCEDLVASITCSQSGCDEEIREELRGAYDHAWKWVVDTEPGCGTAGVKHQVCGYCGAVQNENTAIVPIGKHAGCVVSGIIINADSEGNPVSVDYEFRCPACSETVTVTETDTESECDHYSYELSYEPFSEGWHIMSCPGCGETLSVEPCRYEEEFNDENEIVFNCVFCGQEKTVEIKDVCEHELTEVVENAVCGKHTRRCLVCGEEFEENCVAVEIRVNGEITDAELLKEIARGVCGICEGAVAHEGEAIEHIDATCENPGGSVCECEYCGEHYDVLDEQPIGHSFGEWTIVTPATCEQDGVERRVCANYGGHVETRRIEATGHAYGEWTVVTPATCEQDGVEQRVCANDSEHVETRPIDATGHAFGEWTVVTPATCEQDGVERR
ncbi:MAG: hypothetical protein IIZ66_09645, partial [Clostridia bacterium]|nr:hypothetical protein [Clostridia bacterium]